jgi:hypothetical protein
MNTGAGTTPERSRALSAPEIAMVRAELEQVLASDSFGRARKQAQFLRYLCERTLDGLDTLNEADIAREAFGRKQSFDRKDDSIVRVEAHRLRKRLASYYERDGAAHRVRIDLPPGRYTADFTFAEQPAAAEPAAPVSQPPVQLRPLPFRQWRTLAVAVGCMALVAVAFFLVRQSLSQRPMRASAASRPSSDFTRSALDQPGIRILAGSPRSRSYTDMDGNRWEGDRFFTGGASTGIPRPSILRTRDPLLFETRREGKFRYDIPLEPGLYELHLYFAETEFGPGNAKGGGETARIFNIAINGKPLMWAYDVIADAGGANVANTRIIKDVGPGPGGKLRVDFEPLGQPAFVNAIAVVPGLRARMRSFRFVAGTSAYRDPRGVVWAPERHDLGGQLIVRPDLPPAAAVYPQIHKAERFGNFNYAIPVADGRYEVTLHFSERWFGPGKPAGGGEGSRVFDVVANGVCLLKNFDIFKEAGGPDRAISRTFHNLLPNAQGKIQLSFVPVTHYAAVNAVEIVAEP